KATDAVQREGYWLKPEAELARKAAEQSHIGESSNGARAVEASRRIEIVLRISLSIGLCLLMMAGPIFADSKPSEDYMTTSDGVKIHYYVLGKGTPVILIHGYTGTAWGNWFSNGIAQALAKNHMVVALDCRNHGKSDKPVANGPGKAEDVVELMDHLKIKKAHIHGYSMGGGITG